jgi:hypothetical protein
MEAADSFFADAHANTFMTDHDDVDALYSAAHAVACYGPSTL